MVTADQLRPFFRSATDTQAATALEAHIEGLRRHRVPLYLDRDDLDRILAWKLRGQIGRQEQLRSGNTVHVIRVVTQAALAIQHEAYDYEVELKVALLCALRGVGVPVASAILALAEPAKYGVIDFRGWRQFFREDKRAFSVSDYQRYLAELRRLAGELGWRVRAVDEAVWELDQKASRRSH